MNTIIIILLSFWILSIICMISIFVISHYVDKKSDTKFSKWWKNNISCLLEPEDPIF